MKDETELESLAAYHPSELPPKSWHAGPSDSEMQATGASYFKVGKAAVSKILRDRSNGDVYVHRDGHSTLVHTMRGWAVLA